MGAGVKEAAFQIRSDYIALRGGLSQHHQVVKCVWLDGDDALVSKKDDALDRVRQPNQLLFMFSGFKRGLVKRIQDVLTDVARDIRNQSLIEKRWPPLGRRKQQGGANAFARIGGKSVKQDILRDEHHVEQDVGIKGLEVLDDLSQDWQLGLIPGVSD